MATIEEPTIVGSVDEVVEPSSNNSSEPTPNGPSIFTRFTDSVSNTFKSAYDFTTSFFEKYSWKAITAGILTVAATVAGAVYALNTLKSKKPLFSGPLQPNQSRAELDPNATQTPDISHDEEIANAVQAQEYEESPPPKATAPAPAPTTQRTNQRKSRR
jgi:hypothetical protein